MVVDASSVLLEASRSLKTRPGFSQGPVDFCPVGPPLPKGFSAPLWGSDTVKRTFLMPPDCQSTMPLGRLALLHRATEAGTTDRVAGPEATREVPSAPFAAAARA